MRILKINIITLLAIVLTVVFSFAQTTPKKTKINKEAIAKARKQFIEENTLKEEDKYKEPPKADPNMAPDPHAKILIDDTPPTKGPPPKVEIIIDSSGSMGQQLSQSKTKMYHSKKLLTRYLIDQWKEKANIGMRVYGSQKKDDCDDNVLAIPFKDRNIENIERSVSMMMPLGRTPIAASLKAAVRDLRSYKGPKRIVLFTDGEETCGGNPCDLAEEMSKNKDIDVKIYVVAIGFNPDSKDFDNVRCIGQTHQANDESDLFSETGDIHNQINSRNNLIVNSPNPVAQVNLYRYENGQRVFFKSFTAAWGTKVPPGEYDAEVVLDPFYKFPKFSIPPDKKVVLVVEGKGEVRVNFTGGLITAELLDKNMRVVHKFVSDQPFLANAGKYKLRLSAPPFFEKLIPTYIVVPRGKHVYPVAEVGVLQFDYESMVGLHVYNMSDKSLGTYVTNAPFVLPTGTYRMFLGKDCFVKAVGVASKPSVVHVNCETTYGKSLNVTNPEADKSGANDEGSGGASGKKPINSERPVGEEKSIPNEKSVENSE